MSAALVNKHKIKLLIHAEDGFIPFLTPHLLKTYFPSDATWVKDHLVVGMAIKDTCVVPVFRSKKDDAPLSNKQMKRGKRKMTEVSSQEENNNNATKRHRIDNDVNNNDSNMNNTDNSMKPTGYEFSHSNLHDQQLSSMNKSGYNTMIVPTFDLVDDTTNFFLSNNKPKEKTNNYGKKKNPNTEKKINLPTIASSTNNITFCTPHGFQKLHSSTYVDIALQLESKSTIGLFDQTFIGDTYKRKMKSVVRTKSFLSQIIQKNKELDQSEQKNLWAPLICTSVSVDSSNKEEAKLPERFDDLLQQILTQKDSIAGIAFVGWHHIQSCEDRVKMLQDCCKVLEPTPLALSVLVTDNLKQILDVARYGANIIGCNLPAKWARSRKAFALSLKNGLGEKTVADKQQKNANSTLELDKDGCIDLSNDLYMEDKSSLLAGCTCFSCNDGTYTRSYVHHLIKSSELLADIILFGHNLHQMLALCEQLSTSRAENNISEYCQFLENQILQDILN